MDDVGRFRKRRGRNSVYPGIAAMAGIETCPTLSGGWVAFQSRKKIVILSPLGRRILDVIVERTGN